jgi:hypothetical protein
MEVVEEDGYPDPFAGSQRRRVARVAQPTSSGQGKREDTQWTWETSHMMVSSTIPALSSTRLPHNWGLIVLTTPQQCFTPSRRQRLTVRTTVQLPFIPVSLHRVLRLLMLKRTIGLRPMKEISQFAEKHHGPELRQYLPLVIWS